MVRIRCLRFVFCGRSGYQWLEKGSVFLLLQVGYQWLEEGSLFLLLALRQSLMFPSQQHAVGRKAEAVLQQVFLLRGSGVRAGKMCKLVCTSCFNDPVSFGAIDQVPVNYSQKKKYRGESHKNIYLVSLSSDYLKITST